jgi:hypothetical protein
LIGPGVLLSLTMLLTGGAAVVQQLADGRRRRALRALATSWRMNFNAGDQLRLAARVAHYIPICGAANVTVGDVIYGIDGEYYRYIFTAEYTLGVLRTKKRYLRVASFAEPRDRRHSGEPEPVRLGTESLTILEQYAELSPPARTRQPDQKSTVIS